MTQAVSASQETMLAHAEQAEQMALMLEGQLAFDPQMFQGPMLAGLGPIGAPFVAAYMAAITNHHANGLELAAALHAHAEAVRESALQYQGADELSAAELAADQDLANELGDQLEGTKEAALPGFLKDQLDPLDPGQTQFVGDIASTRHALEKAGIKGADLGIPAKLADGTPIMLFGDSNRPGEAGNVYHDGIVAAKVENTPDGVKVTGIAGWGPGQLLKEQPPAGYRSYPSGVITLADGRQLLTVAQVHSTPSSDFVPVSSHLVQIGGAQGGWETVGKSMDVGNNLSYATGMQVGDTVYVAGTENDSGPIHLYEIPVDHITDQSSWSNYMVTNDAGSPVQLSAGDGQTPQMMQVGDQFAISYMDDNGLSVRLADSPRDFGGAQAQTVDLSVGGYPDPPGTGQAYGGYILPDSQPDDLRFAVSYFDTSDGDPYGVGEWRYRPQ